MRYLLYAIVSIIYSSQVIYAQYRDITIEPKKLKEWTGSYRKLDNNYNKIDGDILMGKGSFYSFFRGFALFDITGIPDDARIEKIELFMHKTPIQADSNIMVNITSINFNPLTADANTGYNKIICLKPKCDEIEYYGYNENIPIVLNSMANIDMQQHLKSNVWGLGFSLPNDGVNYYRTMAGYKGFKVNRAELPYCKVSYSFEYMRTSFQDRKVVYKSEHTFKKSKLTISYWDHMKVDGDIITLYLNGEPILENYYLVKEKKSVTVNVRTDTPSDLFLFAHNEGINPPNTVSLEITDGIISENIILSSDLSSCEAILIRIDNE